MPASLLWVAGSIMPRPTSSNTTNPADHPRAARGAGDASYRMALRLMNLANGTASP